ncbi:MAG: hypothetical protein M0P00_09835 [Bacteroidaceae bacterium]|jgi:hypothetical protein|nr:hypothetical protein [Bacteroidaceae bacterium]
MFLIPFVELNYLGLVNYFGAIKGVMAVLAWFSNEILPVGGWRFHWKCGTLRP